jgi:hypothetical protein
VYYKEQSVIVVSGNNLSLLREPYETHKCGSARRQNIVLFNVRAAGAHSNDSALKNLREVMEDSKMCLAQVYKAGV